MQLCLYSTPMIIHLKKKQKKNRCCHGGVSIGLILGYQLCLPIIINLTLSFEWWGRRRFSYEPQWNLTWNYSPDSVCSEACRKASFCFARAFRGLYAPSAEVSGILRVENNGNNKDPFLHFKCQQSNWLHILTAQFS